MPFFNVEKCPFSLKSALFFEKKGLLRGGICFCLFPAEKCPFLRLKSALLFEKKAFYGEEKEMGLLTLKSALFLRLKSALFSLKYALFFEKGPFFFKGHFIPSQLLCPQLALVLPPPMIHDRTIWQLCPKMMEIRTWCPY